MLAEAAALVRERPKKVGAKQVAFEMVHQESSWESLDDCHDGAAVRALDEMSGLDFSGHPLAPYDDVLTAYGVSKARDLWRCTTGDVVRVAGVRSVVHTPPTRSGVRVVFVTLDDVSGLVDTAFFPSAQGRYSAVAMRERLVVVEGTITVTPPRSYSIAARAAWPLEEWLDVQRADPSRRGRSSQPRR